MAAAAGMTGMACLAVPLCRDNVIDAMVGSSETDSIVRSLSRDELNKLYGLALSGNKDEIAQLSANERGAYDYIIAKDQASWITFFPKPDRDPNEGKLENPIPSQNKEDNTLTNPIEGDNNSGGKLETPLPPQETSTNTLPGGEIDVGNWQDNLVTAEQAYQPNQGAVGNMGELLGKPGFGTEIKEKSTKTSKQYQGQSVYVANKDIGGFIQAGDQFYLDGKHKDHLEVFDKRGHFKGVVNLDGNKNKDKSDSGKGRRLPK